jgi:molybdopterin-guanine dinucleotide biosynthesis protein A
VVIAPHDITGVILCGGEGRRMGAGEKPWQLLHGKPLVQHVLSRLSAQVGTVFISANRDIERYESTGATVFTDVEPGLGPLGGLGSVSAHVITPWIFCCPGDAPLLETSLVSRLAANMGDQLDGAYPHDGEQDQHLFLLVQTATCATIAPYLASGERSVRGWLAQHRMGSVALPELAGHFVNVNSPSDLSQLIGHSPPDQCAEQH